MTTTLTAIDPIPESTTTQPWNDLFEELKTRYPKIREPILAALAVLMQDPDIDAEHAKAVAAANGFGSPPPASRVPSGSFRARTPRRWSRSRRTSRPGQSPRRALGGPHGALKPTWTSRR